MAVHRLSIDEFDEINYELVAIHTSLEDYHLAYFINQNLPILLSKNKNEIQSTSKDGEALFSRFTYDDHENGVVWNLIRNKNEVMRARKNNPAGLFEDQAEIATRIYLVPEFRKVDYFLKIENPDKATETIINNLTAIDRISTIYPVDAAHIKSKNNLIF
jgi:hypothetical protein